MVRVLVLLVSLLCAVPACGVYSDPGPAPSDDVTAAAGDVCESVCTSIPGATGDCYADCVAMVSDAFASCDQIPDEEPSPYAQCMEICTAIDDDGLLCGEPPRYPMSECTALCAGLL